MPNLINEIYIQFASDYSIYQIDFVKTINRGNLANERCVYKTRFTKHGLAIYSDLHLKIERESCATCRVIGDRALCVSTDIGNSHLLISQVVQQAASDYMRFADILLVEKM